MQDVDKIEAMKKALKCDGLSISKELLQSRIKDIDYVTVNVCGNKFMYCGLKMDNTFVVIGEPAACIDPDNWRDEIGRQVSYNNSFNKLWALEAYRLLSERVA